MLKKSLKKLIATALAVATVATSGTAVSASTLTPKKSHSDAEVQETVLYLIDAADDIAFSPYSGFTGDLDGGANYDRRKKMHSYRAYQMCEMLFATPNLKLACDSQTIAELKKARKTWKSAYVSDMMYTFYSQVWYDTEMLIDDKYITMDFKNPRLWHHGYTADNIILHLQPTKVLNKATSSYNRVKNYIAKYQKYNPTLAANITKWNNTQYKAYKTLANKLKTLTPKKMVKMGDGATVMRTIWDYYKLPDLLEPGQLWEETKILCKNSTWYWSTKGMTPFNSNPNSPFKVFMRNTRYYGW